MPAVVVASPQIVNPPQSPEFPEAEDIYTGLDSVP